LDHAPARGRRALCCCFAPLGGGLWSSLVFGAPFLLRISHGCHSSLRSIFTQANSIVPRTDCRYFLLTLAWSDCE
jgi:hypothetical protein